MATANKIMAGGALPAQSALAINGDVGALTATGTATTDAATIITDVTYINAGAANTGVKLPASTKGDRFTISNYTGDDKKLYPPTGGKLNNGSADAAETLATTISAIAVCINNIDFIVVIGA